MVASRQTTAQRNSLVANAVERIDPTKTVVLRNEFRRYYAAAWQRIASEAARIAQAAERFDRLEERIAYFNRQLRLVIDREMGQAERDGAHGIEALLLAAYLRGLRQADADASLLDIAAPELAMDAIRRDDHREEMAALLLLLLLDFRGMVENAVARLQSEYARGVLASAGSAQLAGAVRASARKTGRVNVTGFVSTAVVTAFNAAILVRFDQLGIGFVGGEIEQQFETANDPYVCPLCLGLANQDNGHGPGIYTLAQARGLIPVHRRCRCRWTIVRRS